MYVYLRALLKYSLSLYELSPSRPQSSRLYRLKYRVVGLRRINIVRKSGGLCFWRCLNNQHPNVVYFIKIHQH